MAAASGVGRLQGELHGKLERGASSTLLHEKRQGIKAKAGGMVQGVKNKAKTKLLETTLHKAGQELLQTLTKDKWMPQPVNQSITNMFRSVWPEVESVLFDLLYETIDAAQPKKRKGDKRPWPTAPPSKREQPLRWFRARVVYAIFPADASFWYKVRQPDLLLFLVLLVVPYFGIATLMWLLLLVFIDWDCDFQLINYIVLQRATAFFVFGLLPACKGFVGYAVCINDMAFDPLACDHEGPGVSQSAMIKFAQTFFRSAYSYFAYAILISNRLDRVRTARGAVGNGEEIPQPLWCRLTMGLSAVKRKHLGESSDAPTHYAHVPSEIEEALASSFVNGLCLGMLTSLLITVTPLVFDASFGDEIREYQVDNGLPQDPIWVLALVDASASLMLITNLVVVIGVSWAVIKLSKRSYDTRKVKKDDTQMPKGMSRAEKNLWQLFQQTDVDGSGSLDMAEFESALRKGHYDFSQAELEDMLTEVDKDRSGQLEFKEFRKIATKLNMMRVPEAGLLGRLMLLEQVVWGLVHTLGMVYMYQHVGPQEVWDLADGSFFAYCGYVLRDGVLYPALRRQMYFFPCFVFLTCSLPFIIFKVPILGPTLFGLKGATAYDQLGQLRTPMTPDELEDKWEREQGEAEGEAKGIRGKLADKRAKGYEKLVEQRQDQFTKFKVKMPRFGKRPVYAGTDADADADAELEHGLLRVHLIGAKGLKPADRNGNSDPYVQILIGGQRARSKTIKATLDPQWGETFEFAGVRGELLKHDLQLRVFDWDLASADDKLGDASLSLEPVLHKLEHACEVELSTQGQVSLRLSWAPQGQPMPAAEAGSSQAKLGRSMVSAIPGGAGHALSALDAEELEANGGATEEEMAAASIQARLRGRNSRRQAVNSQPHQNSIATIALEADPITPRSSPRRTGTGLKIPKLLRIPPKILSICASPRKNVS